MKLSEIRPGTLVDFHKHVFGGEGVGVIVDPPSWHKTSPKYASVVWLVENSLQPAQTVRVVYYTHLINLGGASESQKAQAKRQLWEAQVYLKMTRQEQKAYSQSKREMLA